VRYAPDGSLCAASVEQIFPRDGVQRNRFELALIYHDCISNRIGLFELRSTPSVRDRAIIVLNDHRSGDMLLALHRQATHSHRPSMAMPLAAAPYRASGLVL
jgi:hypothetical protein